MKRFGLIITTAVLFCFVGTTAPAHLHPKPDYSR